MRLNFFTEARCVSVGGTVYAPSGFTMALWDRYLSKFDSIRVFARVRVSQQEPIGHYTPIVSEKVHFVALPYYEGAKDFLKNRMRIKEAIKRNVMLGEAYLCRVPGTVSGLAAQILHECHVPYGLEVVGDPYESLSKAALNNNWLSPIYQIRGRRRLKKIAWRSSASLYVTNHILQDLYPSKSNVFSTHASNVMLRDEHYISHPKSYDDGISQRQIRLLAVGTLAQLYKAPDIVLKAIALLKKKNYDLFLTWFGGGQFKEPMEALAEKLGISANVRFAGSVSQEVIREEFMKTDIFVHASRAEGLPRAVIEAMAYGLPCIGTRVAGIPELLSETSIVLPNDVQMIADKIEYFVNHSEYMNKEAAKNFEEAKEYHNDILTERRLAFYDELIKVSKP